MQRNNALFARLFISSLSQVESVLADAENAEGGRVEEAATVMRAHVRLALADAINAEIRIR